jgi:ribonuclease BN (tRNA processing enzyme)
MQSLAVRVVGVGDAFTSRYHNACLLVESPGARVLVDAPPALGRALADLGKTGDPLGLGDVEHVIITHLHGDHVGGLEQLLFFQRFVTGKKVKLHAMPEVLADLWETRLKGGMETLMDQAGAKRSLTLADYAEVCPLDREVTPIGDLAVRFRPTIHHIPTSALRFQVGGASVGYSADTSFDPELVRWLAECDLFFHETNHGIHTPLASLVALPEETKARMRLIHYPDQHDVEGSPIRCAREGERIGV